MLKIESRVYKEDAETLLHLSITDTKGNKTIEKVYPFYVKNLNTTIDTALAKSIDELPSLLEAIYKSGLAKEEIQFSKKTMLSFK